MKKDGFTLIEVILNVSIIMIIFSVLLGVSRFGIKLTHDIKIRTCLYEIMDVLSYGKSVCASSNSYGKIIIDYNNNFVKLKYYDGHKNINEKTVDLPQDTSIVTGCENKKLIEEGMTEILITPDGKIENGYTISVFDNISKDRYDITISVGEDLINLKGDEYK